MSKTTFNYTFKRITAIAFATMIAGFEPAEQERIKAQFEPQEDGKFYKRKAEVVELTLPAQLDLMTGSPEELAVLTGSVTRLITEFVKYQYIDNFLPVGDHSLEAIAKVQAESGGRTAGFAIPEVVYNAAVDNFKMYITAVLQNAEAGEKIANIARQKFTRSAVTRGVGQFNEEVVSKLQTRLDAWATALESQPNGDELIADFTPVYALWTNALNRLAKADVTVDIASIL